MKAKSLYMVAFVAFMAGEMSCSTSRERVEAKDVSMPEQVHFPMIGSEPQAMPPAIVYQTTGADCMDLVPITLTADGKGVASYPAPSDLNEGQTPVNLGDGWWLDRRGIGPNSVFTTYTYEEYEAMHNAPSVKELLKHINHKARITRMIALPITASEAASDPAVVRAYTESGFVDCREIPLNNK